MRSCLPQGNLSLEEEFEIFGEQDSFPSQKWHVYSVLQSCSLQQLQVKYVFPKCVELIFDYIPF